MSDAWSGAMGCGDFAAAWQISDRFLAEHRDEASSHLPRHQQWIWRGEPLDGKRVLIRCYRGYGDIIQFIRYVPLVRARAREVIVWAPAPLLPLIERVQGVDRVLPLHDGDVGVHYDVDVELMELAHLFRTTLDTIPNEVPYFRLDPAVRAGGIGVVWRGGDWDERRNIAPELVARFRDVELLHKDNPRASTPLDLARAMLTLDLVITVDTFAAHLAGALGIPVWTLLHSDPDWRWMRDRDDSPWYPTMRLFRQEHAGEWEPVIERVAAELA